MKNARTIAACTSAVLCAVLIGLSPIASRTAARGVAPEALTPIDAQLEASDFWLAPADAPGDSPLARAVKLLETERTMSRLVKCSTLNPVPRYGRIALPSGLK